jgi:phenylacetate-CoA ligase
MTTKEDVRKHHFAFIAEPMRNAPLISWCTSGTTGTPLKVLYSRDAMTRMWAFVENYRLHAGVSRSLRRAQFTGKVIVPGRQPTEARVFWRYDLANHCLLLSSYHLRSVNLSHYADALDRFAPRYMSGYPSAIYALADYYMRSGRSAPRLVAVLTSAETMVQEQRQTIEKVFNTRVFDQYGQTEMQSFWYECELGRMHAHPLAGITEIVKPDGTPAAPGELGEVVLTGLSNRAMPLIRYRTGDAASFAPEACGCGRSMPVVGLLLGRMDDMIVTRERGVIGRLDPVFKGVRKVKEAQLVQMSADRLRVRLAVDAAFGDVDRRKLETNIRDRVGSEIRLEFEICDGISRGPNGKFRAVISHLTAAERQQLLGNVQPRV